MNQRDPEAPCAATDDAFTMEDLPAWMDRAFPVLFIALGVLTSINIVRAPADRSSAYAVALVAAAVSPWALTLVGLRLPDPVFAAGVLAPIAVLIVAGEPLGIIDLDGGGPQLTLMLLVGIAAQIATIGSRRLVWITSAAAFGIVVAGALVRGGDTLDYTPWVVGLLFGVGGGRAFRANAIHVNELRLAHEALAHQAVANERRRIARDVHDIVAHTMSVTMLHLTAARLAVRRDPDAAVAALEEAERHGRASMDDIRRVVRLLRTDEATTGEALPDDTDVPELVEEYVAAGSDVRLQVDGAIETLAPAHRLAVYRIVQESLSNAVRHGRGPVEVSVAAANGCTEVDVRNRTDPTHVPDPSIGAGLIGMRERVEALGGTFAAGPDGDTGWRVHARLSS